MRGAVDRASWLGMCLLVAGALALRAGEPGPVYSFNVLGLPGDSPESFTGKFAGDDMLPYTDDDVDAAGNLFGTWGFVHLDVDSDNQIAGDPILVTVRNDDDDSTLYGPLSRPEYGVIYESEDWYEAWEANQNGPTGEILDTNQTDFEVNDHNGWTDEANAYVYNHLGLNQHGLGLPKYRVDYRTEPLEGQDFAYDEIQGWKKPFTLRNTADDPDTPFNERGDCRRWHRTRENVDIRGYLIPVEDLPSLEDGSLPTLFGWEDVDLAAYFRDTIGPKLEHPDLFIFSETGLPMDSLLPPTHLYLMQVEIPYFLADNQEGCGGSSDPVCSGEPDPGACQLQQHGAYWGLVPGESKYRHSFLMGFNADGVDLLFGEGTIHRFLTEPEDGGRLNLWVQDHFWRDDEEHFGRYDITTAGPNTFAASLDTAQEVPAPDLGDPPPVVLPSGTATFDYDRATRDLTFHVEVFDLTTPETAAHIHSGAPGVAGPVEHALPAGSPKDGSVTLTEAQETLLLAGELYVNVHTEQNAAGEIRGQIIPDPAWSIIDDPAGAVFDGGPDSTVDQALVAIASGSVSAPLPKELDAAETPIIVVADLAANVEAADDTSFQIIARSGDSVVAYANISAGATQVFLGGSYDAETGTASGGEGGTAGPGGEISDLDAGNFFAEYTRYVLLVTRDGASLRQEFHGEYAPNDYTALDLVGDELASAAHPEGGGGAHFTAGGVTHVTVSGTGAPVISTFLVLASPGLGPFLSGDCDGDGRNSGNVNDAIKILRFNFLGSEAPPCLAACDADGDGRVIGQVTDAVFMLNYSFRGGPAPRPFPAVCGFSQAPGLTCTTPHASCP